MGLRIAMLLAGVVLVAGWQDDDALREFGRAFRPARKPADVQERREAALDGVVGGQLPSLARALIDAYAQLEKELEKPSERHRAAVTKKQRYAGTELRPGMDALRALQDRMVAILGAMENQRAVEYALERVLADDRLPMSLRLDVARLAPVSGEAAIDPLAAALRPGRKAPTLATALTAAAALGPGAAALGDPVIAALGHRDPLVREAAAGALATMALPASIAPLVERLEDEEEPAVRRRTAAALQVLTRVRIGTSADAWRRWLEREGAPYVGGEVELGGGEVMGAFGQAARYHGVPVEGEAVLFLLDRSRSMRKPLENPEKRGDVKELRIDRAKRELVSALGDLTPDQRFGVIGFAASMERFEDELVSATPDNVEAAQRWVGGLGLELGTNIYAALELAFDLAGRGLEDELFASEIDTVFLLTDGRPFINGPDSTERILSGVRRWNVLARVAIHSIGLGDEVPPDFLGTLARENGGRFVLEGYHGSVDMTARPNVVLFVVDDMGWRDAGFAGNEGVLTPFMDRLALEGMRFSSAYVNAPNCAPSRACLMTGLYPPRHGVYTVDPPDRGKSSRRRLVAAPNTMVLGDGFVTLAEALGSAGYATAAIGKWHLGPEPSSQGFDVSVAGGPRGSPPKGYFSPYELANLAEGPEGEYLTDRLTEEAVSFVRAHADEPFFLYLSHYAVHRPIQVPEERTAEFAGRDVQDPAYAAMLASVDDSLGRVLAALDELDLADDTIVCLLSDNGGLTELTSMEPLRGQKGSIYEAGIRVPLVVRWPGRVRAGVVSERAVIATDLFPTLLEAAGVPALEPVDGVSLIPLLAASGDLDPRALFWHFPAYLEPYGSDPAFRARPCSAIRMGRFKLIEFFEDGRLELYNLFQDPGETDDLASTQSAKRSELHAELRAWRDAVGAPVPSEANPDFVDDEED